MSSPNDGKQLKLIKTLWGIDEPISPTLFQSIQQEGYHGVEVIRLAWLFDRETLINSLNEASLAVVCQVHTSGGFLRDGEYIYCDSYNVAQHKKDFQNQLQECKELLSQVTAGGFINVHAGVDAWSVDEAVEFLTFCLDEIERTTPNITVTFETHRQRLFGSPFQTREILKSLTSSQSGAGLKINADLSHWYCACERVFNPKEDRDAQWWPDLLALVAERCQYIHARFGWAQGPQMADPSAAECEPERALQLDVWKMLIENQRRSDNGSDCIFVSPEYGPAPYLAIVPHTQESVASLPAAVSYTKKVIEELFGSH